MLRPPAGRGRVGVAEGVVKWVRTEPVLGELIPRARAPDVLGRYYLLALLFGRIGWSLVSTIFIARTREFSEK